MTDMTNAELADEIERLNRTWRDDAIQAIERSVAEWRQIIAALRRQPSSDKLLVPREPTKEMLAAMAVANVEHDKLCESVGWDGVRRSERIYRAMLAACEAEGHHE